MSWWWYRHVALPLGTMTLSAQDFVDVWARHPKAFWDPVNDFPDLTPQVDQVFLVAEAPRSGRRSLAGSGPRRWGVFFDAAQTEVLWDDEDIVPLLRTTGREVKRLASWRVVATMYEESETASEAKAIRTAMWSYMVAEGGSIPVVGGRAWFGPLEPDLESHRLAEEKEKYLHPLLLAISGWNERVAIFSERLRSPHLQLKLWRDRLPTIGRPSERDMAS